MAEMTLSDYKDKIVIGAGACIIAWLSFLTPIVLKLPTHEEVLHRSDMQLIENRFDQCISASESLKDRVFNLEETTVDILISMERIKSSLDIKSRHLLKKKAIPPPLDFP